ncbi:hypothetical protein MMPV_007995 [Pyropia vietnamensis]
MSPVPASSTTTPLAPYRHIVLFRFEADATPTSKADALTAFRALVSELSSLVLTYEEGTNVSDEGLDDGLTHIFFMSFADAAAFQVYKVHPMHVAFVKSLAGVVAKATVVDWTASPTTT